MIKKSIKRKENGFTIIELLVTIAIIILISTLTITSIASNIKNTEIKKDEQNEKSLQEAALIYVKEYKNNIENWKYEGEKIDNNQIKTKYYCVSVESLINEGYLKENILSKKITKDSYIKVIQNIENKTFETSNIIAPTEASKECS